MASKYILLKLILLRTLCTILVQTWFVPDETWQSVEISHHLVYGNGWLTWEWKEGIRSYIYPSIFAGIFWILKILNLDFPFFLIHIPRLLSAIFFSYGDYCVIRLAAVLYGNASAQGTLKCVMSSWFLAYCAPRTLTSCVETVLLLISLRFFPWRTEKESYSSNYLYWTGIGCCIRPTLMLCFLPFYMRHLYYCSRKVELLKGTAFKVALLLAISTAIDYVCYGKFVLVPLNFIKFNFLSGQSSFYGSHPWHWYFTQGIPVLCSFHLPFVVIGSCKNFNKHKCLLVPCMILVLAYSFCGHKEFRFILPVLPLLLCISGDFLSKWSRHRKKTTQMLLNLWLILPNLILFLYMGLFHQRGAVDVIHYLRNYKYAQNQQLESILFLTPCHSTPLYSHLHINLPLRFLTCEPDFNNIINYKDEAEIFFENPQKLYKALSSGSPVPDCIVMFNNLWPKLKILMEKQHYTMVESFFYSHFPEDNRGNYLNIYCRN